MEQEWKYKITEKQFWNLGQRVSKFYDRSIDLQGYILTLIEEHPNLDVANAYRILSKGRGVGKSLSSNSQKNLSSEKRGKKGGRHWTSWAGQ